jgi:hypothetical protein
MAYVETKQHLFEEFSADGARSFLIANQYKPIAEYKPKAKTKLDALQFEQALLRYERENRRSPSGIRRIFFTFPETRRWFREQFRMTSAEFDYMFEDLYHRLWPEYCRNNRDYSVHVHGAPTHVYKKTNWIYIDKKRWVFWSFQFRP